MQYENFQKIYISLGSTDLIRIFKLPQFQGFPNFRMSLHIEKDNLWDIFQKNIKE